MALIGDTFDRANSTSLGADWTEATGDWEIVSNALELVNNATPDNYKLLWAGSALASNDYYVECDLTTATSAGDEGMGPGARLASGTGDANSDGYGVIVYAGDFSYLVRVTNSADTVLATGAATSTNTNYVTRLICNGTAISMTRGGSADGSATDATYTTGGVGCWWGDFGTQSGRINSWTASDLAAAAEPVIHHALYRN